ncbi:hypothetical protein QFC21_006168 [Naganishia friedmannii]|uniref:Uncharacterized protein n=1 Tax=Naganishia friedmannii TaxID=89922 RepID=A0ACC2V645_9TREE|nr:hypothetical protein QFC21_006168 [Naganishia friedmannii]
MDRRRTPGPSAPASWASVKSFDTRGAEQKSRRQRNMTIEEKRSAELDRRWRVYEVWYERVVTSYVDEGKLPFELTCRSRRKRRRLREDDSTVFSQSSTIAGPLVGPPSLLADSIKVLSRLIDPLPPDSTTSKMRRSAAASASSSTSLNEDTTSWLNIPDVKRLLTMDTRIAIMIHGVWHDSTSWKGIRDLAQGVDVSSKDDISPHVSKHQEKDALIGDDEGTDDWDASSSASSDTTQSVASIATLPILDFSFCQFNPFLTSRQHRQVTTFLRSRAVRTTVGAISFAGSSLTLRQAVELLSSSVEGKKPRSGPLGWSRLKSVSFAGLQSGSVDELKVALLKLARYGSGLQFIDLSGIELFPQQDWSWKALLRTLLSARSGSDKFDYPALAVLGFRYNNPMSPSPEDVGAAVTPSGSAISNNKGDSTQNGQVEERRASEYESEVKQFVRSFARPRWLDIDVS